MSAAEPARPSKKGRSETGGLDECARRADEGLSTDGGAPPRRSVLVWDLDETLIVFNSILDRSFEPVDDPATNRASRKNLLLPGKESDFSIMVEREKLARGWERVVLQVCDEHFFFASVEDCTEAAIGDLMEFDDGADLDKHDFENDGIAQLTAASPVYKRLLAYRLRKASERFALGVHTLLADQQEMLAQWETLWRATDAFTQGWLSAGIRAVTGQAPAAAAADAATEAAAPGAAAAEVAAVEGGARAESAGQPSTSGAEAQDAASGKRRRRDSLDRDDDAAALGFGHEVGERDGGSGAEGAPGEASGRRPPQTEVVNVLVTAGCLLPTLAKLMLFKLDRVFPLTHVFSARRDGKEQCFRRILHRYGLDSRGAAAPACAPGAAPADGEQAADHGPPGSSGGGGGGGRADGAAGASAPEAAADGADPSAGATSSLETRFLVIGDGPEEAAAAAQLGWPCVRIAPLLGEGAVPIFTITPEVLERKLWG